MQEASIVELGAAIIVNKKVVWTGDQPICNLNYLKSVVWLAA
jgi:hypothetical protein